MDVPKPGEIRSIDEIDSEFEQLGCLSRSGFGGVFLARKRVSKQQVVLKFLNLNSADSTRKKRLERELKVAMKLHSRRDSYILRFHEWFRSPDLASVVTSFADGGTLAREIAGRSKARPFEPYAERRIAWYILQLGEALAFVHERGVAHCDLKSSNVLIDWSSGGRLILSNFGTSITPEQTPALHTRAYAAPELLEQSKEKTDGQRLNGGLADAFGLGCILYELLACQLLSSLTAESSALGEFISKGPGINAALSLPCIRLPFVPYEPEYAPQNRHGVVSYSGALKNLATNLLHPDPEKRWAPLHVLRPLKEDPSSPLTDSYVVAAQTAVTGAPVTVDNVQLGMFVQRGAHWDESGHVGDIGTTGVIVKLDSDALFTEVAWPTSHQVQTSRYSIGSNQRYQLMVGPTSLPDFFSATSGTRSSGAHCVESQALSQYSVGQHIGKNCVIVGMEPRHNLLFIAPKERIPLPPHQLPTIRPPPIKFAPLLEFDGPPAHWQPELGVLVAVTNPSERNYVLEQFHSPAGGLSQSSYVVDYIQRVQSVDLWSKYVAVREKVAAENWGYPNERFLFHGTRAAPPEWIIDDPVGFDPRFCDGGNWGRGSYFAADAPYSNEYCHTTAAGARQIFLARVALGRIYQTTADRSLRRPPENHHSVGGTGSCGNGVTTHIHIIYETTTQALPEYLITYRATDGL